MVGKRGSGSSPHASCLLPAAWASCPDPIPPSSSEVWKVAGATLIPLPGPGSAKVNVGCVILWSISLQGAKTVEHNFPLPATQNALGDQSIIGFEMEVTGYSLGRFETPKLAHPSILVCGAISVGWKQHDKTAWSFFQSNFWS